MLGSDVQVELGQESRLELGLKSELRSRLGSILYLELNIVRFMGSLRMSICKVSHCKHDSQASILKGMASFIRASNY